MSIPASDNFNRADGGVGSNWTAQYGSAQIVSFTLFGNATPCLLNWNADVFSVDQSSSLTALGSTGINGGPAVRISSTGGGAGYAIIAQGSGVASQITLYKLTAGGTYTLLQTIAITPTTNDVFLLSVVGTTLQMFQNGVQVGTDQTDAALASGQPGFEQETIGGNNWDNWIGDNASFVPPPTPTRFYLPSGGAPAVTPAVGSGWTNTASFAPANSLFPTDVARTGMVAFAKTAFGASASETILNTQYVSKPLLGGQVLSGTISGQAEGDTENTDPANSVNIAFTARIVQRDGTDYTPIRWLVGPTPAASTSTSTPPCLTPGTEMNRSYRDSSDSRAISYPPSAVTTVAGDRLVLEIGSRNVAVADYIFIRGDDNGTDLPVDDTTTTRYNPWLEFSQTIAFEVVTANLWLPAGLTAGAARDTIQPSGMSN